PWLGRQNCERKARRQGAGENATARHRIPPRNGFRRHAGNPGLDPGGAASAATHYKVRDKVRAPLRCLPQSVPSPGRNHKRARRIDAGRPKSCLARAVAPRGTASDRAVSLLIRSPARAKLLFLGESSCVQTGRTVVKRHEWQRRTEADLSGPGGI